MGLTIGHRQAGEVASGSDLQPELDDHLQDLGRGAELDARLMAVLRMEDREVATTERQERGRGRRRGVFLDVLLGDIGLGHDQGLLVRMAAEFEALIDDLDIAVDLMGFPHLVGRRGRLVALHDRDEVLAMELVFAVGRGDVEGAQVGECLREERMQRLVGGAVALVWMSFH